MTTRTKARRKPRSDALAAIHETAEGLHRAGLMDRETMREFDALCLTPVERLSAEEIRGLREREQVSQPVFAHYLNVSKGIVSKWERGENRPDGASLKDLMKATSWQPHSVRGFLSGTVGKKMKTPVESFKRSDGARAYRISSK